MAEYSKTVNTFTDYGQQAKDIERRRRMAEMLQQQSMQPIEAAQGAPISWTQGLAKMLQAYSGQKGIEGAEQEGRVLGERRNQALAQALSGMPKGTPGQPEFSAGEVGTDDEIYRPAVPAQQPSMSDYGNWMGSLAQIGPDATAIGGSLLGMQQRADESAENRAFRAQQASETRQARIQELQMRLQDQRLQAQDRAQLQAQLAQERAQLQRDLAEGQRQSRMDLAQFAVATRPPVQPQLRDTEQGLMQVDRNGRAIPVVDSSGNPVRGKGVAERAMPASAAGKLLENRQNLRVAQEALAKIKGEVPEGDKNATGWKGFVPDVLLQRIDPEGVQTRAAITDLGSMVIHDRSGAAVTAAEFPRLKPFIPGATDDPDVAAKKLDRFVKEYQAVVDEAEEFYRSSGYKVPSATPGRGNSPSGPPAGIDPAVWNAMSAQDRALFKK